MTYQTGTVALKDVSFTIQDGEFVFIIGRSGAGKSTLIKLLTCEERPTGGKVLIDRYDVAKIRRRLVPYLRRNIGMLRPRAAARPRRIVGPSSALISATNSSARPNPWFASAFAAAEAIVLATSLAAALGEKRSRFSASSTPLPRTIDQSPII